MFRLLGFRIDVAPIVNASNLLMLPNAGEPFGLALGEALTLGKAVVAISVDGPLEIVDDGQTGLLAPSRSTSELAAAITRLLNFSEKCEEMGAAVVRQGIVQS